MTVFIDIVSAIIALLNAGTPVSPMITRARDKAIPETEPNAINVQFDAAQPAPGVLFGAPVDWTSRIIIDCYARSISTSGDLAVDPLLSSVYARIAADTTLSGKVANIGVPQIETEYDSQGQKTGWIRMTYLIEHRTTHLTLE
jgi:hypothetical protein